MSDLIRCRYDKGEFRELSYSQMYPFVLGAMYIYWRLMVKEYGNYLPTPEAAAEKSLQSHNLIVINRDYLLAYTVGEEWFASGTVVAEEYLVRIYNGDTRLREVVDVLKAIGQSYGARQVLMGTRAASNKAAIRRLYARHGLTETATIMRIK